MLTGNNTSVRQNRNLKDGVTSQVEDSGSKSRSRGNSCLVASCWGLRLNWKKKKRGTNKHLVRGKRETLCPNSVFVLIHTLCSLVMHASFFEVASTFLGHWVHIIYSITSTDMKLYELPLLFLIPLWIRDILITTGHVLSLCVCMS